MTSLLQQSPPRSSRNVKHITKGSVNAVVQMPNFADGTTVAAECRAPPGSRSECSPSWSAPWDSPGRQPDNDVRSSLRNASPTADRPAQDPPLSPPIPRHRGSQRVTRLHHAEHRRIRQRVLRAHSHLAGRHRLLLRQHSRGGRAAHRHLAGRGRSRLHRLVRLRPGAQVPARPRRGSWQVRRQELHAARSTTSRR